MFDPIENTEVASDTEETAVPQDTRPAGEGDNSTVTEQQSWPEPQLLAVWVRLLT